MQVLAEQPLQVLSASCKQSGVSQAGRAGTIQNNRTIPTAILHHAPVTAFHYTKYNPAFFCCSLRIREEPKQAPRMMEWPDFERENAHTSYLTGKAVYYCIDFLVDI